MCASVEAVTNGRISKEQCLNATIGSLMEAGDVNELIRQIRLGGV